jgi:tetratricopeptide (TPR) repeat protein
MKKLVLFLACSSLLAPCGFAQMSVVKQASKDISGMDVKIETYKSALNNLKPALTNAESKGLAETWFTAGKASFGIYDKMMGQKAIGQKPDAKEMANALLDGYDYLVKALPLDSVGETEKDGSPKMDKKTGKQKVKTKFSKDIINMISGHVNDFSQAGSDFYEAKDWANAAKCWDIFASMPQTGYLTDNKVNIPDSIIGQVRFYQGIAAWQGENYKGAVDAFAKARKSGYLKKEAFDYAIQCYAGMKDDAGIVQMAKEALPVFGKTDMQYVRIIINDLMNKQNYDEANTYVDQAISMNANNAELQDLKGILLENQKKDIEAALPYYKKSIEINPEYAKGLFDVGRYYFNKAVKARDNNPNLTGAALAKVVNPFYTQALPYMEKAYQLDKENTDAKTALRGIYYALNMGDKLNALDASK